MEAIVRHVILDVQSELWPIAAKAVPNSKRFSTRRVRWNEWIRRLAPDEAIGSDSHETSPGVYRDLSEISGAFMKRVMFHPGHATQLQDLDVTVSTGNRRSHFPTIDQQAMALVMARENDIQSVGFVDLGVLLKLLPQDVKKDAFLKTLIDYQNLHHQTVSRAHR